MKKRNKPVHDYVYDTMVVLTDQINLPHYAACVKTVHADTAMESELRDAKMLMEYSWRDVEKKIDTIRKEFYSLLNQKKWEKADLLFHKYKLELSEYMHNYLSRSLVEQYINIGIRDNVNRNLIYTPGCRGIVFGDKKEYFLLEKRITDSEAIEMFWNKIRELCCFANLVAEQMKADLNKAQYLGKWDRYDQPTLIFCDLFFSFKGMCHALKMLEDLNALTWHGEHPILSMQNIHAKEKDGKVGKGLKRFLGAWLYFCRYDKDIIKQGYNDTTIAMVALKYFGLPCDNENAVREMIGEKAMESDYLEIFRKKFAKNNSTRN